MICDFATFLILLSVSFFIFSYNCNLSSFHLFVISKFNKGVAFIFGEMKLFDVLYFSEIYIFLFNNLNEY